MMCVIWRTDCATNYRHMDTEGYDVQFRELAMRFVSLADEERKRDDENDQSEKH